MQGHIGEILVPKNPTNWISDNSWPNIYKEIYGAAQLAEMGAPDLIKFKGEYLSLIYRF